MTFQGLLPLGALPTEFKIFRTMCSEGLPDSAVMGGALYEQSLDGGGWYGERKRFGTCGGSEEVFLILRRVGRRIPVGGSTTTIRIPLLLLYSGSRPLLGTRTVIPGVVFLGQGHLLRVRRDRHQQLHRVRSAPDADALAAISATDLPCGFGRSGVQLIFAFRRSSECRIFGSSSRLLSSLYTDLLSLRRRRLLQQLPLRTGPTFLSTGILPT